MPEPIETQVFGVDEWVNLALFFIRYYLRHQENIDNAAGSTIADAMRVLAANAANIRILNPPGAQ